MWTSGEAPLLSPHSPSSNQIKSLLLSHHHSTSALVSEILKSVLQTVQKTTIYIWTVHIYRLYRRQCAKYTYIYSVHIVYYRDILNYQLHIIHEQHCDCSGVIQIPENYNLSGPEVGHSRRRHCEKGPAEAVLPSPAEEVQPSTGTAERVLLCHH